MLIVCIVHVHTLWIDNAEQIYNANSIRFVSEN